MRRALIIAALLACSVRAQDAGVWWGALAAGQAAGVSATGGQTTTNYTIDGVSYVAHIFSATGTNMFVVAAGGTVDYLVVAGGGSGANRVNGEVGGGGAGGLLTGSMTLEIGSYTVIVGAGAPSQTVGGGGTYGFNGQDSAFGAIVSTGGGRGSTSLAAGSGGSGGGGGGNAAAGGAGVLGQGYAGAAGYRGGGGGAGGAGTTGGAGSGAGGPGVTNSLSGVGVVYAKGGIGGTVKIDGPANTGNGGSGVAGTSGAGGSGIVIVRYRK